jgi:hypothetical protein
MQFFVEKALLILKLFVSLQAKPFNFIINNHLKFLSYGEKSSSNDVVR